MNANEIGSFLSELRKQKGLKQREVADAIQVSDKAISRWETGRGIPDVESLQNLSDFYEVSINEILAGKRIKEVEMREVADQNVIELVKRESGLKKKLVMAMAGVMGLLVLVGMLLIPIPTVARVFNASDVDAVFRTVAELEEADIDYSISFDTKNNIIEVEIEDYNEYANYVEAKYNSEENNSIK